VTGDRLSATEGGVAEPGSNGGTAAATRRRATSYEVRSGGRLISLQEASTGQEAVLQYVRSLGCRQDEIRRVAPDTVAWRGAVYSAALPSSDRSGHNAA
jgi:hypothetical protein